MINRIFEKIDYSKDPEGPISIGMKLLKKLEKEGWKGGDVYDEIEDIIVDADIKHPKQFALRLKRTLENYDMWEAPYKGLVNKIQKWQYINESAIHESLDNLNIDDCYDDAYDAIDSLVHITKQWSMKDLYDQLSDGDIWFKDVMDEMGIDAYSLSDDEDEKLCGTIINAMSDYYVNYDYNAH